MLTTKLSMLTLVNKHNRKPFCEPSETTLWLRKCQIDLVVFFVLVVVVVAWRLLSPCARTSGIATKHACPRSPLTVTESWRTVLAQTFHGRSQPVLEAGLQLQASVKKPQHRNTIVVQRKHPQFFFCMEGLSASIPIV